MAPNAIMSMEAVEFRRILSRLATGVTVVTATGPGGAARGLTASAVAAVSLDPPLVLACVDRSADTHDCIAGAGAFAMNILGEAEQDLAGRFADGSTGTKFHGVAYRRDVTGAPLLERALAWVECRVWASYDGGDHTIFVGEVVSGHAGPGEPLLHFRGGYARLAR
jgi:flavin reductase (DIM6/NTAB) family NADH-FMN oxidoreductase RutF